MARCSIRRHPWPSRKLWDVRVVPPQRNLQEMAGIANFGRSDPCRCPMEPEGHGQTNRLPTSAFHIGTRCADGESWVNWEPSLPGESDIRSLGVWSEPIGVAGRILWTFAIGSGIEIRSIPGSRNRAGGIGHRTGVGAIMPSHRDPRSPEVIRCRAIEPSDCLSGIAHPRP